jgi:cytochrome c-type protein NapB
MLKHSLIAAAVLGILSLSVTAGDNVVTEEELGLRKTNLYVEDDTTGVQAKFDAPAPGSSKTIERSFVNAPPLISHSVEGLLPITKANNSCLSCHMPEVAKAAGATAIPASHFVNYRPDTAMKDGKVIKEGKELGANNTSDVVIAKAKKTKGLYQGRFNCSQCHVPQANVKPLVANEFQADFGDAASKSSSNLIDVMNSGVQ